MESGSPKLFERGSHPPLVSGIGECKQEAKGEGIRRRIFSPGEAIGEFPRSEIGSKILPSAAILSLTPKRKSRGD